MSHTLVFDIGKTHARALVFDAAAQLVLRRQCASGTLGRAPYPQLDVDGLWEWMESAMRESARAHPIGRINVSAHGATAALLADAAANDDGLALPVLDYECTLPAADPAYDGLRPAFAETLSPVLPAGLNLGRQLWWQQRTFPAAFARARTLLTWPQYWVWRLCGVAVAECSALGCHTDLWAPRERRPSSLLRAQGWESLLPPLHAAASSPACIRPALAAQSGLGAECAVFAGVHDSNSGFARHRRAGGGRPFVLVSTGTWVVCMASAGALEALDERRDMLANVDVDGNPVACARFMGGREFAVLCAHLGADPAAAVTPADVQPLVDAGVMALPDFSAGSGPFGGCNASIRGRPGHGTALATLYLALMLDYVLDLLAAPGEIVIEGAFLANPMLCALLAALRGGPVQLAAGEEASAFGAALLCGAIGADAAPAWMPCAPCEISGLAAYRDAWRDAAETGRRAAPHGGSGR